MYLRGLAISQLKRFSSCPQYMFCSKLNRNSRPYVCYLPKAATFLRLDPRRKSNHLWCGRYLRTSACLLQISDQEIKRQMEEISEKFREAMELLSDARSSMGTVYFSDDMTEAEILINEVRKDYENLLANLSDSQSKEVTRAIGLKMEELKAQLQLLKESIME